MAEVNLGAKIQQLRLSKQPRLSRKALATRILENRRKRGSADETSVEGLAQYIYSVECGRKTPSFNFMVEIADALETTLHEIFGVNIHRSAIHFVRENEATYASIELSPDKEQVSIPVVGTIRAGLPIYAEQNIIDYEEVSLEDVADGEYFFLQIKRDSMVGAGIHPGSRVLIRRQDYIDDGKIAVVLINGEEATIKRVKRLDGKIILYADNPKYAPIIHDAQEVKILGRAVKVITPLD